MQKLMRGVFVIAAVCSAAASVFPAPAHAQHRYYRHHTHYPRYYDVPHTEGYYAAPHRSYGNIHGGGLSYYGDPGYSSMDSNGQRRTGSDVPGSMGGMGR